MGQHILIFAPFAALNYHTHLEVSWAHALRVRGHRVTFLTCDGLFDACDMFTRLQNSGLIGDSLDPRHAGACRVCEMLVLKLYKRLHNPTRWLGDYLPAGEREEVEEWCGTIQDADLPNARWRDQPVGLWFRSSLISQYRSAVLQRRDVRRMMVARRLLSATALASEAVDRALADLQPDSVLLLNGRFFAHHAMIERCKQRGIRFLTHERGLRRDTIRFSENEQTHQLRSNRETWAEWADVPLSRAELEATHQALLDRQHKRRQSWLTFSPAPQEVSAVRAHCRLDERPVVAVFTSSPDEIAAFPERRRGAFPGPGELLAALRHHATAHPELMWVIRIHPNINTDRGTNHEVLADAHALRGAGLENLRVVMPREDVSSYTLADIASVGVVSGSTIGLEMACAGQPVARTGGATYAHTSCSEFVDRPEVFWPTIAALLERGRSIETARVAYRWAHRYFLRICMDYPLVTEEPQHMGQLRFGNTDELLPGRHATLDRICSFIVDEAPLLPPPDAEMRARPEAVETTFLREMRGLV